MSYRKKYYEENKEAIAEYRKKYREENKEAIAEQRKKYYEENKEAIAEQKKKYYEENKEAIGEQKKKYYEENKEAIGEHKKKYHKENKEATLCTGAKTRSKSKNISFDIDKEYLKEIWPKDNKCPALGIEFKRGEGMQIDYSPSIDRIIPELGYVKGNVQIICMLANRIKSNATPDQVIQVGTYFKKIAEGVDNEEKI